MMDLLIFSNICWWLLCVYLKYMLVLRAYIFSHVFIISAKLYHASITNKQSCTPHYMRKLLPRTEHTLQVGSMQRELGTSGLLVPAHHGRCQSQTVQWVCQGWLHFESVVLKWRYNIMLAVLVYCSKFIIYYTVVINSWVSTSNLQLRSLLFQIAID